MTQIRLGLRRGDIPLIGGIQRLAGSDKIGIVCLFQQRPPRVRSRLHAIAATALLLKRGNLRILARQGFDLLEQRLMPRRNLAQLGIEILDRDFLLSQNSEEIRPTRCR